MPYGLSVDVGTSFTAAAVSRLAGLGKGPGPAPQVLPLGIHTNAVPSVIFIGEDGRSVVGEAAERRGLAHPERLAREIKRRIGDEVPLVIGDSCVLPEDLFATMVRWVVDQAEEREGEPPIFVTLTHPAEWGGHKTALLHKALAGVGLTDVTLLAEPLAAALHYASQERVEPGTTLAVYDFGGGTFDATVVRKTDTDAFAVLGTPEGIERLGGADFDQDVFGHVLTGASEAFAGLDRADPAALAAVARLRRECAEAKEALSTDPEVTIAVLLPGAHTQVRLVRSEFEAMIEGRVHETIDRLDRTVVSAGIGIEDLSAVLLIGGSSRIPLVAQLISERLVRPVAIDADPKASIALGAAFASAVLQDTDGGGTADDADSVTGQALATAPGSVATAAPAFTPRHGPSNLTTNRRIRTRAMAVTAAVALLGVASATAANSPTSMAALSDVLALPEQAAEAAEIRPAEALPGHEAPVDDPGAEGWKAGSVPRAAGSRPSSSRAVPRTGTMQPGATGLERATLGRRAGWPVRSATILLPIPARRVNPVCREQTHPPNRTLNLARPKSPARNLPIRRRSPPQPKLSGSSSPVPAPSVTSSPAGSGLVARVPSAAATAPAGILPPGTDPAVEPTPTVAGSVESPSLSATDSAEPPSPTATAPVPNAVPTATGSADIPPTSAPSTATAAPTTAAPFDLVDSEPSLEPAGALAEVGVE